MSAKDQDIAILNPFTGNLDMIRKFNVDRIATHNMNPAGNQRVIYDLNSGMWIPEDPAIVTDDAGNVVVN